MSPRDPTELLTTLLRENVQPRPGRGGWHGGPTPLGAVRGVSAEVAAWTAAPGRKNIWQLVLHIAYWKYAVRRRLDRDATASFPRTPSNWPALPDPADERRWKEDVALLRREHERLLDAIDRIPLADYGAVVPQGKRWSFGELIVGIAQHDAYHTGQIQMLKRLHAAMAAPRPRRRPGRRPA